MAGLSEREIRKIADILEEEGYQNFAYLNQDFRFDVAGGSIVSLQCQYPVLFPEDYEPPVELLSFGTSVSFRVENIDQNTLMVLRFLAVHFRDFYNNKVRFEHQIKTERTGSAFLQYADQLMPVASGSGQPEHDFLGELRLNINNAREMFPQYDDHLAEEVVGAAKKQGFEPTFDLPPELEGGFERGKENRCLVLKTQNEYLLIEPGYITYWGDHQFRGFWLRQHFHSGTLHLFRKIYEDANYEFHLGDLFLRWVDFSRGIIPLVSAILESPQITAQRFAPIDIQEFLREGIPDVGLFHAPVVIEAMDAEETRLPNREVLSKPPESLQEMVAVNLFSNALLLLKNRKYDVAAKILAKAMMLLNKHGQKKGVIEILVRLTRVADSFRQYEQALKYLSDAREVLKSIEDPDWKTAVLLHTIATKEYENIGKYDLAFEEATIVRNFLRDLDESAYAETITRTTITMARLKTLQQDYPKASLLFREVNKTIKRYPRLLLTFYWELAKYHRIRQNLEKELQVLLELSRREAPDDETKRIRREGLTRLGQILIYDRGAHPKGLTYLQAAEKLYNKGLAEDLEQLAKLYEFMSDAHRHNGNTNDANYFAREAGKMRAKQLELEDA